MIITREDLGDAWPFTVDELKIGILGAGAIVATIPGVRKWQYAINGLAQNLGYAPIDPIWAENPMLAENQDIPVTNKSLSPLIRFIASKIPKRIL